MQNKQTDLELIADVLTGKQAAYAEIVKRHKSYVFTLALRMSKNREDAEEIAQDCFVKAYRSLAGFQQNSKFSTWLYRIVFNTAMTYLRKKRLETTPIDEEGTLIQLSNVVSDFRADAVEKQSKYVYLNKAIAQLLPDDAAIITLFYQGEQSLEEIANSLGMEANTVKVKLHRARQRLKTQLELLLQQEVKDLI
ncbi:MAG: RNA polymerase sigma factor [Sphingobacteriaceae bacterium]